MLHSLKSKVAQRAIKNSQFLIKAVKRAYKRHRTAVEAAAYSVWAQENDKKCFVSGVTSRGPLISIVVPAFNPEPQHFLEMVYSVVNQHYQNWELIIVNASSEEPSRKLINDAQNIDVRIKIIQCEKNRGIAGNTNLGIDKVGGNYIAFFDHDDLLHPCALHCIVSAIQDRSADVIYTDEDKIKADDSQYFDPFRKPKWSPNLFRNVNYINHLTVIRADYVRGVHGLRPKMDGAQDYDLLLRVIDAFHPSIIHIPRVLYHWRAAASSTAAAFSTKTYVLAAGTQALQEHLDRNRLVGKVKAIVGRPGFYEVEYAVPNLLSIVVGDIAPSKQRLCANWLQLLVNQPRKSNMKVEVIIGEWFSAYRKELPDRIRVQFMSLKTERYLKDAAEKAKGEIILYIDTGILPTTPEGLARLAGCAYQTGAIVSPVVLDEHNLIIDAGYVESPYGLQPLFRGSKLSDSTYYGTTEWVRDVAAISMQVFGAPASVFRAIVDSAGSSKKLSAAISQGKLQKIEKVTYTHTPFVYKGRFIDPPMFNETFCNPELIQVMPPLIDIVTESWGEVGDRSEREIEN